MSTGIAFRSLADNAPDGVIIINADGRHLYVNQAMANITGYTQDELLGLGMADLIPPEDIDRLRDRLRRRIAGEVPPNRYELTLMTNDGGRVWVEITTGRTEFDGELALFGIFRDITERRQAEAALRRSEQSLRAVIDNTPGCVYHYEITDGRRRDMIFVDPGLVDLLGPKLTASLENRADRFLQLIHPDDRERLEPTGIFDPATTDAVDVEYRVRTERGYRWIRSIAKSYPIDRHTVRWYGVFFDIDNRKRAAERLERMDRLETVGTIAGGIAHEVHNALYPAATAIDKIKVLLAEKNTPDPGRLSRLLVIAENAITRAFEMTRSITRFSRLAVEDSVEPILLREFMEQLLAETPEITRMHITPNIEIDGSLIVNMNRAHASSLFSNLIANALEAMEESEMRLLSVRAQPSGEYLNITIADSGPGIGPDLTGRIWEPFFTTKTKRGTGLGLAVCRRIADLYHGDILLESPPGGGASFTVSLPHVK